MNRKCPHCGDDLPDTSDAFCPECREPLNEIQQVPGPALEAPTAKAAVPGQVRKVGKHTIFFLTYFYALALIAGIEGAYGWAPLIDLLFPIALIVSAAFWTIEDSKRRGRPIPLLSRSWCYQSGVIVAPVYCTASRGWRGAMLVLLHAFGFLAFAVLVMYYFAR